MVQGIVQLKVQHFQQYTEKQNPNMNQLEELADIYVLSIYCPWQICLLPCSLPTVSCIDC